MSSRRFSARQVYSYPWTLISVGGSAAGLFCERPSGRHLLNAAVYNIWPTRIAERTAAPEGSLLSLIQALDPPLCAIPSGHVSLPVAIACSASHRGRGTLARGVNDGST